MEPDNWHIALFKKSVLKQNKFKRIEALVGETQREHCLDIGADNGVISYLLRQKGGSWKSADLDPIAVSSIQNLVGTNVFQIDGSRTPFDENEFDKVVIVDFLEHIPNDQGFIDEIFRILKPGGELVISVPHVKNTLLRKFKLALGQTDEKHGHLRPGYTFPQLKAMLGNQFTIICHDTFSKFFSELIDSLITFAYGFLKGEEAGVSQKGVLVTGSDMKKFKKQFLIYSAIYPLLWFISRLDNLLFFRSGYMMVVKARTTKVS